jgi:hypothetical protein
LRLAQFSICAPLPFVFVQRISSRHVLLFPPFWLVSINRAWRRFTFARRQARWVSINDGGSVMIGRGDDCVLAAEARHAAKDGDADAGRDQPQNAGKARRLLADIQTCPAFWKASTTMRRKVGHSALVPITSFSRGEVGDVISLRLCQRVARRQEHHQPCGAR